MFYAYQDRDKNLVSGKEIMGISYISLF